MAAPGSIRLVFMLEEESAMHFLEALLPEILQDGVGFLCIPHEGKDALRKSIPRKLKRWRNPNDFFVILHDQDSHNCVTLKQELRKLCEAVTSHSPLVRIACRELEAWYFGDLDAVEKAFPKFRAAEHANKSQFRDPDQIVNPSAELQKIIKNFNKLHAASEIPKHMTLTANKSKSFNHLQTGVREFANAHLRTRNP